MNLVADTINEKDINLLIEWLKTNPKLTKGIKTIEFEKKFSNWIGSKYSIFVNSGSSANLLMLWALFEFGILKKGDKVFVPSLSWATDVSPIIQLGLEPVLIDTNYMDLSINLKHFETLIEKHRSSGLPKILILVHVLGFVPNMSKIIDICKRNNILLLEDACEAMGSMYENKKVGTFGLMGSYSTFYGHHFSTIEGGLIVTDNEDLYNILLAIRSHGWSRDMNNQKRKELKEQWNISDFNDIYTFYYSGFNLRSTDLQAYIGITQLDKIDDIINKRNINYLLYDKYLDEKLWRPKKYSNVFVSNFAYPLILFNININPIIHVLLNSNVEVRPLICGTMSKQPFYKKRYNINELPYCNAIDKYGFYLPNHQDLTDNDIKYVCKLINNLI